MERQNQKMISDFEFEVNGKILKERKKLVKNKKNSQNFEMLSITRKIDEKYHTVHQIFHNGHLANETNETNLKIEEMDNFDIEWRKNWSLETNMTTASFTRF